MLRQKEAVRRILGYLPPQERGVHPRVSAEALLDHFEDVYFSTLQQREAA